MSDKGVAVITGGGGGIGSAIALRFAEEGFHVGVIGRHEKKLLRTKRLLERSGFECDVRCADVRQNAQIKSAIRSVVEPTRSLAVAVACAGVGGSNSSSANDRWDNVVKTNLYGTYYTFNAAIDLFDIDKQVSCSLIAISSLLARLGVANYTAYCAAKSGILGLVRSLAVELAPRGIRVNAICPGWVDTRMARKGIHRLAVRDRIDPAQARDHALQSVPLGRMSTTKEIAELAAFLVGKGGQGFTGQAFDVNNGGWMG